MQIQACGGNTGMWLLSWAVAWASSCQDSVMWKGKRNDPNSISEVHWFNKTALKQGLSRHSNINLDLIKASVLKST